MKKYGRKEFPSGFNPNDFKYSGRPAKDQINQDDFDDSVGIADLACVDQFGEENKAKYYHGGVLFAKGKWFTYFEWGRIFSGKSWENGIFRGQDYQFFKFDSEEEARKKFQSQCRSKNIKRLEKNKRGIWIGKKGKDGYVIQDLAARERGLPDAYTIKDSSGIKPSKKKDNKSTKKSKPSKKHQKQVVDLALALLGGTRDYARAASASSGVIPTLDSIKEVREHLIPEALKRLKVVGDDIKKQIKDKDLADISNHVAALVPRSIPRNAPKEERAKIVILSSDNILSIQQDLDAFESALENEDFEADDKNCEISPFEMLNAQIEWIDPNSTKGRWLHSTFKNMTNNRHSYMRGQLVIKNVFEIIRPDRDSKFIQEVKNISNKHKSKSHQHKARLQPKKRDDLSDVSDYVRTANIFLGIHGTRSVNVGPILQTNFKLPKQLSGVKITGAAFGGGIYFATDYKKSYGYTSGSRSFYGGGGSIKGRGLFMFLGDVAMGDPYVARSTGSWSKPPNNKDSIIAYPDFIYSLSNDEHIIFDPNHQRIRYLVELDFV